MSLFIQVLWFRAMHLEICSDMLMYLLRFLKIQQQEIVYKSEIGSRSTGGYQANLRTSNWLTYDSLMSSIVVIWDMPVQSDAAPVWYLWNLVQRIWLDFSSLLILANRRRWNSLQCFNILLIGAKKTHYEDMCLFHLPFQGPDESRSRNKIASSGMICLKVLNIESVTQSYRFECSPW